MARPVPEEMRELPSMVAQMAAVEAGEVHEKLRPFISLKSKEAMDLIWLELE